MRSLTKAAVTAQIAKAAITSTRWRTIAVQRRICDWSKPKQSLPNSKSSSISYYGHRLWRRLPDESFMEVTVETEAALLAGADWPGVAKANSVP